MFEQAKEVCGKGGTREAIGLQRIFAGFDKILDVAVATHKTIDLVIHTQVYKLKRDMGK